MIRKKIDFQKTAEFKEISIDFRSGRVDFESLTSKWHQQLPYIFVDIGMVFIYTFFIYGIVWFAAMIIQPTFGLVVLALLCLYNYRKPQVRIKSFEWVCKILKQQPGIFQQLIVFGEDVKSKKYVIEDVGHLLTEYQFHRDFSKFTNKIMFVCSNKEEINEDPDKAKWNIELYFDELPKTGCAIFTNYREGFTKSEK